MAMPTPDPHPPRSNPAGGAARRVGWALAGGLALGVVAGAMAGVAWLWHATPDAAGVASAVRAVPSRIVSADGTLLGVIGERTAQPVTLEQVSPHLVAALLATEDRRFHSHVGVDPVRLVAAAWRTIRGDTQGGSTLTQQLARNLFPQRVGSERSLMRKLRELVVALKIEQAYSKREILTMYLNQVPFLYNVNGVEMASRTYFDKPASDLQPAEAALLVAMLKGPGYYDPVRSPGRALARRNLVLEVMARHGGLARPVAMQAQQRPLALNLRRHDLEPLHAPHYVHHLRRQALAWADARGVDLSRDGLTIHATLDLRVQRLAEAAAQRQADFLQAQTASSWTAPGRDAEPFGELWRARPGLWFELLQQSPAYRRALAQGLPPPQALDAARRDGEGLRALVQAKTRLECGLVALDPRSGQVRAWVGSRDHGVDRYDHVALAQRQPGSTFKPFVYGAALRSGMNPWQTFVDESPHIALPDGKVWTPTDAGGATGEAMTLRTGLARSRNAITAQVMQRVGAPQVARFAQDLGVTEAQLAEVPSLALGTSPVSLLEMVRAYGTLASLGVRRDPVLIERIVDARGQELARFGSEPQAVVDEGTAVQLVDMLRDAVDKGTGRLLRTRFALRNDLAGKTGTTQNNADGWFIAMQPDLVVGAWVGFNDPRVTLRHRAWRDGGRTALLLVGDLLQALQREGRVDPTLRFPAPPPPPPAAPADLDGAEEAGATFASPGAEGSPAEAAAGPVAVAATAVS